MSTAVLEQLQQSPGFSLALVKDSLLTGVALDPAVVETSELGLKRLLDLLPRMEVRGGILKIRKQKSKDGKWCALRH